MSISESRISTKWSAIRSKAVPSNLTLPRSDSSLTNITAGEIDGLPGKPSKHDQAGKVASSKPDQPTRLSKPGRFAGSTS